MRILKWTLLVVGLFAAFLICNSAGLFTVTLQQTRLEHEFSFSMVNDLELRRHSVRLNYVDDLGRQHESSIGSGSSEALQVDAELARLEFEGRLWMPLYKQGSCAYEVRLQVRDLDIHGTQVGKIRARSIGIYPLRVLEEDLRERIFAQVCESLRERTRP